MSSPVPISISHFIKIDRKNADPIYLQIAYQLINAIRMGLLEEGDRLPGTRVLADQLNLHRKTVVAGLEELRAQGWIETQPGVGTYLKNAQPSIRDKSVPIRINRPINSAPFAFRKNFILDIPELYGEASHYFTDGTPDYRWIAPKELVRFYVSVLSRKRNSFEFVRENGNDFFEKQLCYYLNSTRGLHLSKEYVIPIKGRQQVYSVLAQMLVKKGDLVLVGERGYFIPNMIFNQAGAKIKTIPVDEEGMKVSYIRKHFKKGQIRLVYVNSFSQYPTTAVLSDARKEELLELATELDFILVEDAWEEEFVLEKVRQSASLMKMDTEGRVIHTGVFGGFLAPDFQMNYLIGPKDFIKESWKYRLLIENPNRMMEQALAEMISEGDIHRYRRKAQRVLTQRKKEFESLLKILFSEEIQYDSPTCGLAFWLKFKKTISLVELQRKALELDLFLPRVNLYQNPELTAIRLGFAHLNEQEMEKALNKLKEAYISVLK